MPKSLLSEFVLSTDIETFFQHYWRDVGFYEEFLRCKLEDLKISIGPWRGVHNNSNSNSNSSSSSSSNSSNGNNSKDKDDFSSSATFASLSTSSKSISRDIGSFHPAKVRSLYVYIFSLYFLFC